MHLIVRNLCKSFGQLNVLNNMNLDLEGGRIYCLMGPSGSGKTTLMRILMGLDTADSGEIRWQNDPPADPAAAAQAEPQPQSDSFPQTGPRSGSSASTGPRSGSAVRPGLFPRFSAVFQEDRLCEAFTPVENVMMAAGRTLSPARIRWELCLLLPEESLARPVSTLSGGMKRRTAICRALLAPYDVLFMDEPFTGLDEETKRGVIALICEKTAGKLVLISTHQEEDVSLLNAKLVSIRPL